MASRLRCAELAGRQCLVFLASDFHFPLARLDEALDPLSRAFIVPVIVWDPAETRAAAAERADVPCATPNRPAAARCGCGRACAAQWREAVAERRATLAAFFANRGLRPFWVQGAFDADAMSEYFFEANA